ncbi:MAG: tail assembly protein [Citrobacter sp.]
MREVQLYGHLGKKFGRSFMMDVSSPAEAIRALCANFREFAAYLREYSQPGYHVIVGQRSVKKDELQYISGDSCIKIIPVVSGSGGRGVLQTIVGAVLLVASMWFPALAPVGWAMLAGGVVSMLTSPPSVARSQAADNQPSYAFAGAVNTTAQGNPVPICYGEMVIGSQVVSAGISTDEISITRPPSTGGLTGREAAVINKTSFYEYYEE